MTTRGMKMNQKAKQMREHATNSTDTQRVREQRRDYSTMDFIQSFNEYNNPHHPSKKHKKNESPQQTTTNNKIPENSEAAKIAKSAANVRNIITPTTATTAQKQLVTEQAVQPHIKALKQKQRNLSQSAAKARIAKQQKNINKKEEKSDVDDKIIKRKKAPTTPLSAIKYKDLPQSAKDQNSSRQFEIAQQSLKRIIIDNKYKLYQSSEDAFSKIQENVEWIKLNKNIKPNDIKKLNRTIINMCNSSLLNTFIKPIRKEKYTISRALLMEVMNILPVSINNREVPMSGGQLTSAVKLLFQCQGDIVSNWSKIKKGDSMKYTEPKEALFEFIQIALNLDTIEAAKQFVTKCDIRNGIYKDKLQEMDENADFSSFVDDNFIPFKQIYNSSLGSYLYHKLNDKNEFEENADRKKLNLAKKIKGHSTSATKAFICDENTNNNHNTNNSMNSMESSLFSTPISSSYTSSSYTSPYTSSKNTHNSPNNNNDNTNNNMNENKQEIVSNKGTLKGTTYFGDGVGHIICITGQNIKSTKVELELNRGVAIIQCSCVNISKPFEFEGLELFKTTIKPQQWLDSFVINIDRNVTLENIGIYQFKHYPEKIMVTIPIDKNKMKKIFQFKTSISNLQFKRGKKMVNKRRRMIARQVRSDNVNIFDIQLINDEELKESIKYKNTNKDLKKLESLSDRFEDEIVTVMARYNVVKRYIDNEGLLDTNTIYAMNRTSLAWPIKDLSELHLAILLIKFDTIIDMCLVWTSPDKRSDAVVFNISDCKPYKINIKDSMEHQDLLIP